MKVLTAESMRALDRRAIQEVGIPGLVLMENAAIGVIDVVEACFPEVEGVVILCGPGNNGRMAWQLRGTSSQGESG